jgi:ketosteroid isomerase-like protein
MSLENVAVVRACLEAAQRGEVETALAYYSEDVVWFNRPPDAGPYHGREGVVVAIAGFAEHFDDYWFEVERLIDAGDAVVLLWRQGGKGRASGAPITEAGGTVFDLEGGSIRRARVYSDRADALEAVGLSK